MRSQRPQHSVPPCQKSIELLCEIQCGGSKWENVSSIPEQRRKSNHPARFIHLLRRKDRNRTRKDGIQAVRLPFPFTTPPVKKQFRNARRRFGTTNKIFFPLIMARAQRRPFQIVSTSEKSGTPQAMTEGVIISSAAFCESAALRACACSPLGELSRSD